ncbi:MAG: NAD-dependent epimerase/dehydratase family protein [Deltaproteobacteria bacterium]|nr:NAD-dependent epimerase/dehydratase family protein [Deltaproteobacteria bacterium]
MNVLVMGGTQFNGLALVHELARTGHRVTILNRGKTEAALPSGIERLTCDRTDHAALGAVLSDRDWDCVFDISAYQPADVEAMVKILRGRTGHYVFASSTVIYAASDLLPISEDFPVDRGEQQNPYGLNKLLCEDVLLRAWREYGFPASIVAFSMVFGPHNIIPEREQRMFIRLLRGRSVLVPGDGTTLGQVGHVYDEARALRAMMQKSATFGRRYNLTGADCFSDDGYVDTFAEVMGVSVEKVYMPPELMDDIYAGRVELKGGPVKVRIDTRGDPDTRGQALFQINRIIQRIAPHLHHWNRSVFFSIDRLKADTGWAPELTFRDAVEQTWDWMRSTGRDESLDFEFDFEDRLIERIRQG